MKVLDLRCESGHLFEGWFGSEDDYQAQRSKGMLSCPLCESLQVEKVLSAPHVARKSNRNTRVAAAPTHEQATAPSSLQRPREPAETLASGASAVSAEQQQVLEAMHTQWLAHARAVVAKGEDVGSAFAEEARKIHEGQAPERLIHGQATVEDVVELLEEGVPILPLPAAAKEPVQ